MCNGCFFLVPIDRAEKNLRMCEISWPGLGAIPNLEKMAEFLKSFVWRPVYGEKVEPR